MTLKLSSAATTSLPLLPLLRQSMQTAIPYGTSPNRLKNNGTPSSPLLAQPGAAARTAQGNNQQMDGLNTVLPIGHRKINALRTLTTESLTVLMPFRVQEIMDEGGIYCRENAISHNLIMCNKAKLLNPNLFLLGVPGSGKFFSAKMLIGFLALATGDDILICDPEREPDVMLVVLWTVIVKRILA